MAIEDVKKRMSAATARVFGKSSTYTQAGNSYTIDVTIKRNVEYYDEYGQVAGRLNLARFALDELPVAPKYGDTILQDGRTWYLEKPEKDNGYTAVWVVT